MIWESHPWRAELCDVGDRLEQWSVQIDLDNALISFQLERDVMVSAYAIRKLLEARKLADSTAATRLDAETFPLIDRVPDAMNWHRLDEFYDFDTQGVEQLSLQDFCNQVIHSFIFMPETTGSEEWSAAPRSLVGFFVASDHRRSKKLYRLEVDTVIRLLRLIGNEDVVSSHMTRDERGNWQISNMTAADLDLAEPGWRERSEAASAQVSIRGEAKDSASIVIRPLEPDDRSRD